MLSGALRVQVLKLTYAIVNFDIEHMMEAGLIWSGLVWRCLIFIRLYLSWGGHV